MRESIEGLHVKDYRYLDVQALEEIICLNEQLKENLKQIRHSINDGTYHHALYLLDTLLEDNDSHTDYCRQCQEVILADMECTEASTHFEDYMNPPQEQSDNRRTPCDYQDYDGHYSCPFDAQGGDDCRNYCGLGVDE